MKKSEMSAMGGSAHGGKTKLKQLGYIFGIVISAAVLGTLLQFAKAWTEPASAPQTVNIGAPVNTGINSQIKTGLLTAGTLSSPTICINGDCKNSWPATTGGDNLGNHTATQNLNMTNGAGIRFSDGSIQTTAPKDITCPCGACWIRGLFSHDGWSICTPAGWVEVQPDTFSGR